MSYFGGYFGGDLDEAPPEPTVVLSAGLNLAEYIDEAFERCGIDPATLVLRHLRSARRSLSLMFAEWPNKGVTLWTVDEQVQVLTADQPLYVATEGTISILDMVVRRANIDTPVMSMSRSDFAGIPSKDSKGLPTRFYFERLVVPQFKVWQVPENDTDTLHYWRVRAIAGANTPTDALDVTSRWFEAVASGLAAKLAVKFAPTRVQELSMIAQIKFSEAKLGERQSADLRLSL